MGQDQTYVTQNLLRFCYTCDNANHCDAEETSRECWADKGYATDEIQEEDMTAELLRLYAQ